MQRGTAAHASRSLRLRREGSFTAIHNQTGQPAISLPLHWSADGLPIGVQFAGRIGEEDLLLSLAGQLEQAKPWFDKVAPL
jgi:amidase